jgi:Nitronate monooxygenase/pfkB family carbohydrate kinase
MVLDGLRHPIVQAPMGGGPSTVALAAAVCDAGGLGFLAAGYLAPPAMRDQVRSLRAATGAPFGVNVFMGGPPAADPAALAAYVATLPGAGEPVHDDDHFAEKVAILLEERPAVVSFTFGCPEPGLLRDLARAGIEAWVTVAAAPEASRAQAAGAAALVVQGAEAGGHRGGFDDAAEPVGLLALLRLVARAASLPLIATGGLMDRAGVAAARAAGAAGVAVTRGADGCSLDWGDGVIDVPAIEVPVVDTTGCGDAFDAGFIAALLHGCDYEQAAWLAVTCGSLVATGLGSDAGLTSLDTALDLLASTRPDVAAAIRARAQESAAAATA